MFLIMFLLFVTIISNRPIEAMDYLNPNRMSFEELEIYQHYKNDLQFEMMVEDYGVEYAYRYLRNIAQDNIYMVPFDGGGEVCYRYVKNIRQTSDHNCGTTTLLQTLYGLNSAGNVLGGNDKEKIESLDRKYSVDAQGCLIVYQLVDGLNEYNWGNQTYRYTEASNMSRRQFEDYVATALTYCKPVVLHARTGSLNYYGEGNDISHYLSLDYINRRTKRVRIADCHFDNAYFGFHDVSIDEAHRSISRVSGRYLIH